MDFETDPAHDDLAALRERLRYPEVDGVLFDEAARCFEQGAYRAALVMTWLTIAEGLRYRFTVAAERDPELMSLLEELAQREKERYAAPAAHSHQPTSPASGSAPCPPPAWTRQGPTSSGRISTTAPHPRGLAAGPAGPHRRHRQAAGPRQPRGHHAHVPARRHPGGRGPAHHALPRPHHPSQAPLTRHQSWSASAGEPPATAFFGSYRRRGWMTDP